METEQTIQDAKKQKLDDRKAFLKEIIVAASRYERLLANKDFKDILLDLKNLATLHDEEVKTYLQMYSLSSSFFKKMRLAEVMGQHQLRKEQITEAINYPATIVSKANEARTELDKIKEQELKETTNG